MNKMNHKTAPLTIISEIEAKDLINKSGEPFKLHKLRVKSANKGKEFEAILFSNGSEPIELGKEKTYSITEGTKGGWVIRELRDKKQYAQKSNGVDRELEIWRIAMQTAVAIGGSRTVPDIMGLAQKFATELKSKLK